MSLNRENKGILGDSMVIGYSGISSAQNTNKLYLGYIFDSTQYAAGTHAAGTHQEDIKVCVYSHTYIYKYSDIYMYAYPHMPNPEIAKECGLVLLGIMAVCKNFFRARAILRFVECKNCFNLFLFFDWVQGLNKLTLDNGIIIVYNVGNNQSRRLK